MVNLGRSRRWAGRAGAVERASAALAKRKRPAVYGDCPSHPEGGQHECMPGERRCSYCGEALAAYPCNGCGKFLTAAEMHENESRCRGCA